MGAFSISAVATRSSKLRIESLRPALGYACVLLAICAATTSALAQDAYTKVYSKWLGSSTPLDVINGGPTNNYITVAPEADVSGQLWTQTIDGDSLRFKTQYLGADMCLDVANGGEMDKFLLMAPCGNYSGQLWYFRDAASGGGYWLEAMNRFTGDTMCMSIVNGGEHDRMVQMQECGNFTGQMWQYNY